MSRLIVVSNRVADVEKAVQSGGLAVALGDALQQRRGVWFGWDGSTVDEDAPMGMRLAQQGNMRTATVPLTRREYQEYYLGFSNKVLWPTFHYRLDLGQFETAYLEGYRRVNQRMAQQLCVLLEPDDLVWVHDYHLIPLAEELRSQGARQKIGFFLHIPFPPPDIFIAVPDHEWLARTLFSYDVVGFQTSGDASNFVRYVTEHCGAEAIGDDRVRCFGHTITARAFPIGIDVDAVYEMAHTSEAEAHIARLQRRSMANMFVLGVDRLDYTKGLPGRMKAFRRLLELHPEMRKAVTFMQIAPPTREEVEAYTDIRQELEGLSGAINGEFADFDWTPVRYIHRAIPRSTLAALFRGSQVGLVTPLRDGMNLVAKEYVASQDWDNPGALVLSKFAGAAEDLQEAILVNPYDTDEVCIGLHRGLTMPVEERRERYTALIARVRENDVTHWRQTFLNALQASENGVACMQKLLAAPAQSAA
ncbi:MAG: alpha,alpha-trehalose-phosphate synthase (UDP-forming) [Hyphomicrobiaceae bacterium]|nr:alpha,alpha-trehalose-phosphate synthase (UDP-forming) [Hyphomicrobiaceae bacterium]